MNKRHESTFLTRLDRVFTHGVSEVHKGEMSLWFGKERITRAVWREIAAMWADIVEDPNKQKLLVGGLEGTSWFFVYGQEVGTSEESYLQDVRYLAGHASAEGELAPGGEEDD